jgi:hypothetical protein
MNDQKRKDPPTLEDDYFTHSVPGFKLPSPGVPYLDQNMARKLARVNLEQTTVNHPPHYTQHPSGVECIDVVRHMNFNRGNAMKYIWRADEKGRVIEDLKKAIWYLEDEIRRLEPKP